jgi:hypothetical protein
VFPTKPLRALENISFVFVPLWEILFHDYETDFLKPIIIHNTTKLSSAAKKHQIEITNPLYKITANR